MRKEFKCSKCGAVHYYKYCQCGNCGIKKIRRKKDDPINKRKIQPDEKDVACLVACVHAIQSAPNIKTKSDILKSTISGNRKLVKYFRAAYDEFERPHFTIKDVINADYEYYKSHTILDLVHVIVSGQSGSRLNAGRWKAMLELYPKEFRKVLNGIIRGSFKLGMTKDDVNKVFKQLKFKPILTKKRKIKNVGTRTKKRRRNLHRVRNKDLRHSNKRQ